MEDTNNLYMYVNGKNVQMYVAIKYVRQKKSV